MKFSFLIQNLSFFSQHENPLTTLPPPGLPRPLPYPNATLLFRIIVDKESILQSPEHIRKA